MSGTVSSNGSKPSNNLYSPPANAMSCGFTNDATASHGPSLDASTRSSNNSTTCSANTPSRTVPQSDLEAPWGSRPIHPENPNGFNRSALRYASTAAAMGWPSSSDAITPSWQP